MVDLFPHQKEAVSKLSNGKILWGGVGTGKSLTVLAYYMEKEFPADIYVITTATKRDKLEWEGEAVKFGISSNPLFSPQGVRIVVDSWNNISKYEEVEDAFFVFDEQRVTGNGAWVKSFKKIAKYNRWVLLSATPGDTWMDYIPVFIANGFYKNSTEFKREHVVYAPYSRYPKVLRYTGTATLEKYRNIVLVEMPFSKHTTRHLKYLTVDHDKELFKKVYLERWNPYTNQPHANASEMFYTMRKCINSDRSRLEQIRELLKTHPKMVIFYNFDYELDILRELCDEVEVAEWNGHYKQPIPNGKSWVFLVQYQSGAEGWNCTETDTMVFYSLTYSYKNFEQSQGRIDRLNTPFKDLYYYILVSNSVVDRAVRDALKNKEMFNERKWLEENPEFGIDLLNGLMGV